MIWVIPAFKQVFTSFGANLPAPTLIVMAISDFFVAYWWLMVGDRRRRDHRLPVPACDARRRSATSARPHLAQAADDRRRSSRRRRSRAGRARWRRCSPPACRWSNRSTPSPAPRATPSTSPARSKIQTEVSTGTSLTNAMHNTDLFPTMVLQMTQIGEESGSLDGMLSQGRRLLRARSRRRGRRAVEPARADHHRVPRRRHRRPRRRDVPADLQARRRSSDRARVAATRMRAPPRSRAAAAIRAASARDRRAARSAARACRAMPADRCLDPIVAALASPRVVGLCVGSFLNVVIHRLPKMLERGWREQCAELAARRPRRSSPPTTWSCRARSARRAGTRSARWRTFRSSAGCVLRGKCAACKRADLGALSDRRAAGRGRSPSRRSWRFGVTPAALAACVFLWTLLALTFIDFDTQLLPDDLTLPLLWAGLLVNLFGAVRRRSARRRDRRDRRLPVAVDRLLAVQADPRQGGHGLRRLQAARRARRLARLADAAADRAAVVGRRRRDRHFAGRVQGTRSPAFRWRSVPTSRSPARSRCSSASR